MIRISSVRPRKSGLVTSLPLTVGRRVLLLLPFYYDPTNYTGSSLVPFPISTEASRYVDRSERARYARVSISVVRRNRDFSRLSRDPDLGKRFGALPITAPRRARVTHLNTLCYKRRLPPRAVHGSVITSSTGRQEPPDTSCRI